MLAACMDEGVPALELRVISNEIEEADRALWRFDDAFAELARVTALVIPELDRAARRDRARVNLGFGFSPCPNDTFSFDALVHGRIEAPFAATPALPRHRGAQRARARGPLRAHEALVRRARRASATATRCCAAAPRSGAAAGRSSSRASRRRSRRPSPGASPSRAGTPPPSCSCGWPRRRSARSSSCATTGSSTPSPRGEVDAGLIIHESRFTYAEHGLVEVADLGAWWEAETGLPIPLGAICARSDLGPELIAAAEDAVRRSVEYAFAHPLASADYVRAHSQELSDEVCRQHIDLYVNEFSRDLGDDGMAAVDALLARSAGTPA